MWIIFKGNYASLFAHLRSICLHETSCHVSQGYVNKLLINETNYQKSIYFIQVKLEKEKSMLPLIEFYSMF
jgi:hypothetical protein